MSAPSWGDRAAVWAFGLTLGGVTLYMVGWQYAARFFVGFGVGMSALSLPTETILIHGSRVLALNAGWLAAAALVVTAVWRFTPPTVWTTLRTIFGPALRLAGPALAVALLAGSVLGLRQLAWAAADQDRAAERATAFSGRPAVAVWVKDDALTPDLRAALTSRCHRLLIHGKDSLILIRPLGSDPRTIAPVLLVPTSVVTGLRVFPTQAPCP